MTMMLVSGLLFTLLVVTCVQSQTIDTTDALQTSDLIIDASSLRGDFGRGNLGPVDFGRGDFRRGNFGRGDFGRGRRCSQATCYNFCPFGRVQDFRGCDTCQCRTSGGGVRPGRCPRVPCRLRCPNGYETDFNGCPFCQCRTFINRPRSCRRRCQSFCLDRLDRSLRRNQRPRGCGCDCRFFFDRFGSDRLGGRGGGRFNDGFGSVNGLGFNGGVTVL